MIEHYYDDFIIVDLEAGGGSALRVVAALVEMLGPGHPWEPGLPIRSPIIDPAKTKPTGPLHTVLGVVTDMSPLSAQPPHVAFL